MKGFLFFFLLTSALASAQTAPRPTAGNGVVLGVFVGTSPCGAILRPLHGIATTEPCDQLQWRLTLYQNTQTRQPTTFTLDSEAGHFVDNQTTKTISHRNGITGTWTITQGTKSDPAAVVYRLNGDNPAVALSLLRLHPALLHPLNADESLLIGTGGASYTLSKTER